MESINCPFFLILRLKVPLVHYTDFSFGSEVWKYILIKMIEIKIKHWKIHRFLLFYYKISECHCFSTCFSNLIIICASKQLLLSHTFLTLICIYWDVIIRIKPFYSCFNLHTRQFCSLRFMLLTNHLHTASYIYTTTTLTSNISFRHRYSYSSNWFVQDSALLDIYEITTVCTWWHLVWFTMITLSLTIGHFLI